MSNETEKPAGGTPLLMLDTGGHMAKIEDIAFTPDGRQLVSASDDKTIRVWDLATAKTVRTIRGEISAGDPGKIYAMALSPDGKWLATGGWFAPGRGIKDDEVGTIRLYDFASGRLVALLKGHENVVSDLAFSPDGRHLISGSGDFTAILWDIGSLSGADSEARPRAGAQTLRPRHRLTGHRDDIYAVGFTPDSAHAVTGSSDHDLRLWRVADGREAAHLTGHGDKVSSLAVAPDGTIASGDESGEIRLWNWPASRAGADGRIEIASRVLARQGTSVGSLSFSPDGKTLLSGISKIAADSNPYGSNVYDVASGREIVTYRGHDNIVLATAISPDGRWTATGGGNNHEIHIWDLNTGARRKGADGQTLTLAGQGQRVWAAGFSEDGRRIGWGNVVQSGWVMNSYGPLQYALTLPSAAQTLPRPYKLSNVVPDGHQAEPGPTSVFPREVPSRNVSRPRLDGRGDKEMKEGAFLRARAEWRGWSLQHRKGGNYGYDAILDIRRDGKSVASIERGPTDGYGHWAYSFSPDGEAIISSGANGQITAYDRQGRKVSNGDFIGHEGVVWAVAPSPDGRYLVSSADDQTVRLWNLQTRELLVTLFRAKDGEWVMWTPEGYYISSPDGDQYVGWQINRGPDTAADYVRASQLSGKLFRPDIVARTIELASATAALAELGERANIIDLLRTEYPPEFRILLPENDATIPDTPASVVVEAEANPDPVEDYDIFVNTRQVATRDLLFPLTDRAQPIKKTLKVPLQQGENAIRIVAKNRIGTAERDLLLHFAGQGQLDKRGTLYIVAIGVDDYTNCAAKSLRFAGADARAFCEHMLRHVAPLHQDKKCLLLAKGGDQEPTRLNIENAMLLFRKAKPEDTVVLFLAGHGANEGRNYVFLPQDTAADGTHFLPASVLRWHVFQEALQTAQGRRLMFVDTCHSGGAYNARLVKEAHDSDIIVFSATDSITLAEENDELGHGVFTYALTQGLAGEADLGGTGEIELTGLLRYVSREVRSLSNGAQIPEIHLSGVKDFVIARK